jgi:hypothetical protein
MWHMHVVPEGGEVARKLVLSLDAVSTRKLMLRSIRQVGRQLIFILACPR